MRAISSFGTRSARRVAMALASLHRELRELARVVPVRGEDAPLLVVQREPSDLRLDELEPPLVRDIFPVNPQVGLEALGPPDERAEVFRNLRRELLFREDLADRLARGALPVGEGVEIPQASADYGLSVALAVHLRDEIHDLARLNGHPRRVFLEERSCRAVSSLPLCVDPRHGRGSDGRVPYKPYARAL